MFQQFFLAEHATLLENVADGLLYAGAPLPRRRQAALDALEAVNLAGRASARPTQRLLDSRPAARALSLAITHSLEPAGVVGPPDP